MLCYVLNLRIAYSTGLGNRGIKGLKLLNLTEATGKDIDQNRPRRGAGLSISAPLILL